jgi:hypothetical protein
MKTVVLRGGPGDGTKLTLSDKGSKLVLPAIAGGTVEYKFANRYAEPEVEIWEIVEGSE